jgi:putative ABC transport system permease protein
MAVSSDIRYAVRLLGRSPIFAVTAVLSLAAGVAASTAIFSLADALLLRPRTGVTTPYTLVDIGRTTRDGGASQSGGFDNFGYPLFVAMRERTTLMEGLAAQRFGAEAISLGDAQASERVFAALVSGNFFSLVGARPARGRFFLDEEDRTPGTHPVVVLNHAFWTRRFDQRESIVGETIRLNNLPYSVVGIAEPGFNGTTIMGADLWIPMAMEAQARAADRSLLDAHDAVWMTAVGRLKPGVSAEQAQEELNRIMRSYMTERNDARRERWGIAVAPSARVPVPLAGPFITFVAVLGALTGVVLLIACSNVAAMLLARAIERRREVATRLAIGASRRRIVVQLLLEGLTLALLAGAASVPLAYAVVGALSSLQPSLPVPLALELLVDWRVLGFAFALSAAAALAFALLPALQATRFDITQALHGSGATTDQRRVRLRQGLVVGQVAMALLLMVAAGLFLRSLQQAGSTDAGFAVENVDTVQIDTRIAGYRTDAEGARAAAALLDRFRLVPGVSAVGASRMVPLQDGGLGLGGLRAPGYVGPDGSDRVEADWDVVSVGYFDTLQIPIVKGRAFGVQDREGAVFAAIVNETFAARVWPGRDAVGQRLIQETERDGRGRTLEIVGVARNAKYRTIGEPPRSFIYVPAAQQFLSEMTFYVRRAPGGSRIADLRRAVAAFDPNLPVIHAQTLQEATTLGLLPQRLAAWIAGSVGTLGLLLAAVGLYGLTAFSVAQRAREIALRLALGASRKAVLSLVLKQSGRLALMGTAVGLALAVGAGLLVQSLLVGVGSFDPAAFGVATCLLSGILLAASWAPARRAARMDPMRVLRAE